MAHYEGIEPAMAQNTVNKDFAAIQSIAEQMQMLLKDAKKIRKSSFEKKNNNDNHAIETIEQAVYRLNLRTLQRHDKSIERIIDKCSYAALYIFDIEDLKWERAEIEGVLFIYVMASGKCGYTILNRKGTPSPWIPLNERESNRDYASAQLRKVLHNTSFAQVVSENKPADEEFEDTEYFVQQGDIIVHRMSPGPVLGLWIPDYKERAKMLKILSQSLTSSGQRQTAKNTTASRQFASRTPKQSRSGRTVASVGKVPIVDQFFASSNAASVHDPIQAVSPSEFIWNQVRGSKNSTTQARTPARTTNGQKFQRNVQSEGFQRHLQQHITPISSQPSGQDSDIRSQSSLSQTPSTQFLMHKPINRSVPQGPSTATGSPGTLGIGARADLINLLCPTDPVGLRTQSALASGTAASVDMVAPVIPEQAYHSTRNIALNDSGTNSDQRLGSYGQVEASHREKQSPAPSSTWSAQVPTTAGNSSAGRADIMTTLKGHSDQRRATKFNEAQSNELLAQLQQMSPTPASRKNADELLNIVRGDSNSNTNGSINPSKNNYDPNNYITMSNGKSPAKVKGRKLELNELFGSSK